MTNQPSPDVQAFLDLMKANPRPAMTAEFLAQIRNMPMDMMAAMDLPVGDLAVMRDVTMPGPGGDIALRLFDARENREAGPVIVFFHGGGFCVGGIGSHAGITASMARQLDLPVISVEYRLAPENPWPAGIDDAEAAARWIAENAAAFGQDYTSLILSGDSAGGTLTLVTSLALRDKPAALPLIFQLPIYPGVIRSAEVASFRDFSDGYGLDLADMTLFEQHYAADKNSWRNVPILADVAGSPPTLLVTAAFDPLRDGGRAYAAKLIEAGVQTGYMEIAGQIHGFCSYRKLIPSAVGAFDAMMDQARVMIAQARGV